MNISKFPITAAAVLLAGCTVGPNFTRPDSHVPQAWCSAECQTRIPSQTTPDPISTTWWTSFNDPELVTLEQRVAGTNLDLKVASLRLAESRAMRTVTASDRYPTLDGNASVSRQRASANGVLGIAGEIQQAPNAANGTGTGVATIPTQGKGSSVSAFNLFQAGFDSSWELDLWGRVRREIEAADASVRMQAEARRDLLMATMAEVARDYIQLRGIQTDFAITLDNLNAAKDIERVTRERHANGLASELDVAEAASQVSTEGALLPQLEQQENETINRLSFLLGQAPGALRSELREAKPIPPTPRPSPRVCLPIWPDGVLTSARRKHRCTRRQRRSASHRRISIPALRSRAAPVCRRCNSISWEAGGRVSLPSDLKLLHALVLVSLARMPTCRQVDLKSLPGVASPHLTRVLDELTDRGLVWRARSSEDRRQVLLSLTDSGRGAASCVIPEARRTSCSIAAATLLKVCLAVASL